MSRRQPKLILREACIEDMTRSWVPGNFLEVGAGTGYMTRKFLNIGFYGACYDLGEESRCRLRQNLNAYQDHMTVVDSLSGLLPASFDYLFAFEVLEHIEDDQAALMQWTRYLKPRGKLLISVPAHAMKYGKSDELVGHVRRYERHEIVNLLKSADYTELRLVNYGFPLTELTRAISNRLIAREKEHISLTPVERSTRSSFTRPQHIRRIIGSMDERIFSPFKFIQRAFYEKDWGDGMIVTACKA